MTSALEFPPAMIITGNIGTGKSTEGAKAFQNYLWVVSNPKALRRFERWLQNNPDSGYKLPKVKVVPRYANHATRERTNVKEFVDALLIKAHADAKAGNFPYKGIVFDEWSSISDMVYTNIQGVYGKQGGGMFASIENIKEDCQWMIDLMNDAKLGLVFISHWQEIKYHEAPQQGPVPTNLGDVKYPAGPKFPIGTQIRDVCKEFDMVWELGLKGSKKLVMRSRPDDKTVRKIRDDCADLIPPEVEVTSKRGFRELLVECGYEDFL